MRLKQLCPVCGTRSKKIYRIVGDKSNCSRCGYTHKPSQDLRFDVTIE